MCDPVGLQEIADRLAVKPRTAQMWRHRNLLPAPEWEVSGSPAWDWPTIRQWADDTGRGSGWGD